jgi:ankyrin repeat protein
LCRKGHGQIVSLVLEHGGKALLKDINKRGLTPLGEAIVAGHAGVADQLIEVKGLSAELLEADCPHSLLLNREDVFAT